MIFYDEQICFCFDFIPQGYRSLETHHFQTESFFNPRSVDFMSGLIFYLIYLKKLNWAVCSENSCLFFSWSVKTAKGNTVFEELHKHLGAKENSFFQQKPQTRLTASPFLSFFCVSFISSQGREKLRKQRRLRRRKMADFQAAALTFICFSLCSKEARTFLILLRIWFHLSPSDGVALLDCSMSHDDFHDELEKKLEAQKIHRPVKRFSDVLNVSIDITVVGLLGVVSLWETNEPANVAPRVSWVIRNLCFNARTKSTSPWPCTFGKSWYVLKAHSVWDTRCSHVVLATTLPDRSKSVSRLAVVFNAGMENIWPRLERQGMWIFKDFVAPGNVLGARCPHQRVVSFQELLESCVEILTQRCTKMEESRLKDSGWRLIQSISVPAWKRTKPPRLPSSTCTARGECLMTSPSGWSAPASWGSTASPLTSRTAPWPLGHTSTSVSAHKRSSSRLNSFLLQSHSWCGLNGDLQQMFFKELKTSVFFFLKCTNNHLLPVIVQRTSWCWARPPRLQRSWRSPCKCPRLKLNGSWFISSSLNKTSR